MASKIQRRVGKAQAREAFSSLVESVATGAGAVEITDYGKVAAVLISEKEYKWLCTCAEKSTHSVRDPRGYLILSDDVDLEEVSRQVAADFEKSIKKTAREL